MKGKSATLNHCPGTSLIDSLLIEGVDSIFMCSRSTMVPAFQTMSQNKQIKQTVMTHEQGAIPSFPVTLA